MLVVMMRRGLCADGDEEEGGLCADGDDEEGAVC